MKKKNLLLVLLAFALALSASVGTAWAYFTTYARAQGGYTIHLGSRTEIHEDVDNGGKHISITNLELSETQKSQPVYVRAKAFAGSQIPLSYSGSGWHSGADGYWYYDKVLYSGDTSGVLDVGYSIPKADQDAPDVNIVVIYESTPATFDEKGNEVGWNNAGWDTKLNTEAWKGGAK